MIINRMCATFGKLEQASLELRDGLNIIEAPNESGKSTWAAFLRAMFYGINTRERDRKNVIAEKNLYQPWSGASMEGVLELTWQGRDITLRRFQKGSTPFGGFEAVYTASGSSVPNLTGENAGELLLEVGREVYERSAFVGQSVLHIDQTAELESRIAALASSGQEDVSFSQTQKRLKEWQNRRKYNKSGLIPQIELELETIGNTLGRMDGLLAQASGTRSELEILQRQEEELEQEQTAHEQIAKNEIWQRYQAVKGELDRAKDAFLTAETEARRYGAAPEAEVLRNAQERLNYLTTLDSNIKLAYRQQKEASEATRLAEESGHDLNFDGFTSAAAWNKATADTEAISAHLRAAETFPPAAIILLFAGFLIGSALCGAGIFLFSDMLLPLLCGGAGIFILLSCAAISIRSHWKTKHQSSAGTILSQYPLAETADDILRQASKYGESYAAILSAKEQENRIAQALREMGQEREQLFQSLLSLVHPFAPTVSDLFGISAALSRALTLDDRRKTARREYENALHIWETISGGDIPDQPAETIATAPSRTLQETESLLASIRAERSRLQRSLDQIQGELRSLGDPDSLRAQYQEWQSKLAARTGEHKAISLALEALSSAHDRLEERFSPVLNQKTGEILAAFTANKYSSVFLSRDLEALATETGGLLPRRTLSLSTGTVDQLYLAVRLAVCEIVLPAYEPVPLVLDDALAAFDDARMGLALDYLRRLPRQILFFTCHRREAAYCSGLSDVTIIPFHS